ncbi:MAG: sigma 54-interacting transcriptional regulator [Spirochaetia bacterium]|nr:sigma 54-interacting transcriptional regulator [Spirochaetia bacterium]
MEQNEQFILATNSSAVVAWCLNSIKNELSSVEFVCRFLENKVKFKNHLFCVDDFSCYSQEQFLFRFKSVAQKKEPVSVLITVNQNIPFAILRSAFPHLHFIKINSKKSIFLNEKTAFINPEKKEYLLKVQQAASNSVPVLLLGESGSGKNFTANLIHNNSSRRHEKFEVVCLSVLNENLIESTLFGFKKGAFTGAEKDFPGLFETVSKGTIFFDEIAELNYDLQIKLYSILDSKCYYPSGSLKSVYTDARMIFATDADLAERVRQKKFRKQFLNRIAVFIIKVPALRHRKEDIYSLALSYCRRIGKTISMEAVAKLYEYDWPGNIRELENCLERAGTSCKGNEIRTSDLIFDNEIFNFD